MAGVLGAISAPLPRRRTGTGGALAKAPVGPRGSARQCPRAKPRAKPRAEPGSAAGWSGQHGVRSRRPPEPGVAAAAVPGDARPPPRASGVLSGVVFIDLSKGLGMADRASPCSS